MPDTDDTQESAPTIPSYAIPNKKKGKKVCTKYYYVCMHVAIYVYSHNQLVCSIFPKDTYCHPYMWYPSTINSSNKLQYRIIALLGLIFGTLYY